MTASKRRKSKPPEEERCPHCGCPDVPTYVRQNAQGVYSYTSCPGCNSVNGEPPKGAAPRKGGAR